MAVSPKPIIIGTRLLCMFMLLLSVTARIMRSSIAVPIIIGLGLTAIHLSFGLNAGSAINPTH